MGAGQSSADLVWVENTPLGMNVGEGEFPKYIPDGRNKQNKTKRSTVLSLPLIVQYVREKQK